VYIYICVMCASMLYVTYGVCLHNHGVQCIELHVNRTGRTLLIKGFKAKRFILIEKHFCV